MTSATNDKPIADPASQHTDDADASIVPDRSADVGDEEDSRTERNLVAPFSILPEAYHWYENRVPPVHR